MKRKELIEFLCFALIFIVFFGMVHYGYAIKGHAAGSHDGYSWDIDSLESDADTLYLYSDTSWVPGYYNTMLVEWNWVVADTYFMTFWHQDSIEVYLEVLTARKERGTYTVVLSENLGYYEEDHLWIDLNWDKSDPDDTVWGPYFTHRLALCHIEEQMFTDSNHLDSVKWSSAIAVMDEER